MNDGAFGFGQGVTGGSAAAAPTRVKNAAELRTALEALTPDSPPTIIELVGVPPNENAFDFGSGIGKRQAVKLRARGLTLRPFGGVVLKNFRLAVDCDVSDNILITGLSFHSDGAADGARDAIDLDSNGGAANAPPSSRVRITRCSFDGYFDIAIDVKTAPASPRLLVTIDHCLFFDSRPGLYGPKGRKKEPATFVNRGAINFATDKEKGVKDANAFVTIANNAFIDVWRRSPRIARGTRAHVFNNILFRWGITDPNSPEPNNGTWRGMEVGGGENANPTDDGTVLIQANRFIPWSEKPQTEPEIKIHPNTHVDLRGVPPRLNVFDTSEGKPVADGEPVPTVPEDRRTRIDTDAFYRDLNLEPPQVVAMARVGWLALVREAGPPALFPSAGNPRRELENVLQKADKP
jgi:hypothetical protein